MKPRIGDRLFVTEEYYCLLDKAVGTRHGRFFDVEKQRHLWCLMSFKAPGEWTFIAEHSPFREYVVTIQYKSEVLTFNIVAESIGQARNRAVWILAKNIQMNTRKGVAIIYACSKITVSC